METPNKDLQLTQEVDMAAIEVLVAVGIFDSVILNDSSYESVRDGWRDRKREMRDWLRRQLEEIHDFGEHFDS